MHVFVTARVPRPRKWAMCMALARRHATGACHPHRYRTLLVLPAGRQLPTARYYSVPTSEPMLLK